MNENVKKTLAPDNETVHATHVAAEKAVEDLIEEEGRAAKNAAALNAILPEGVDLVEPSASEVELFVNSQNLMLEKEVPYLKRKMRLTNG